MFKRHGESIEELKYGFELVEIDEDLTIYLNYFSKLVSLDLYNVNYSAQIQSTLDKLSRLKCFKLFLKKMNLIETLIFMNKKNCLREVQLDNVHISDNNFKLFCSR